MYAMKVSKWIHALLWNYAIQSFDGILHEGIIERMKVIFLKGLRDLDRRQKIDLWWSYSNTPKRTAERHGVKKTLFPSKNPVPFEQWKSLGIFLLLD
jgi:hypothetical protein